LYVSRKYGGRGLMQLQEAYIIEITKLMEYVDSTEDPLIQIVRRHQNNTKSAMVRYRQPQVSGQNCRKEQDK
jgi:repressor of nif and glnA expression